MKENGSRFFNIFLVLGFLTLILTVTYRVCFYASYLNLESNEIVFDWIGEEKDVWVYTDANSWIVEDDEYIGWATISNRGSRLHIYAYQNNSKEERSAYLKIRSGAIKGLGNKWRWFRVVQKGKQATYLIASRQTVAFSEVGGAEPLQISTDGDEWYVLDCPDWIKTSISGNTLVLTALRNEEMSSRVDMVCIKANDIEIKIIVSQKFREQEEFTDFWRLFYGEPAFQKSRIKYPLRYSFFEYDYDGETDEFQETIRYIYENEWKYETMYDEITTTVIKKHDDYAYFAIRTGIDCGIYIKYIFNSFNGKWYLTKVDDYSD